jgi:N-methylhydantoinase A/oxoprolinase/acetone carboxylase beta subunit
MFLLGIDTGGTFTDAVLYHEPTTTVVAKAKTPTTHDDLSVGVCGAIDAAVAAANVAAADIELVSLSTTLATNALVEGKGRAVCSVLIGFDDAMIERAGLREALAGDPSIVMEGGHDSHGGQRAPLDLERLAEQVALVDSKVDAFAVTSQFSVRNPAHEVAARTLIQRVTGKPVSCSHELSAKLNGPKRAVTAVLNARLISIIDELVATTEAALRDRGMTAPLMVVRGDGSLVSAAFVRERPIETILSGPAASLVGAGHLTNATDAIISDIGGTTTDIAVLRNGIPAVDDMGATVGGHQTMVAAVQMHTHGLGGDSHVRHDPRAAGAVLLIGPRRVIPLSVLALTHRDTVVDMLQTQLRFEVPQELHGVVVVPSSRAPREGSLSQAETDLLHAIGTQPVAAAGIASSALKQRLLDRLVSRGAVRLSAFTPTDACHVLGLQHTFDVEAAELAADLFRKQVDRLAKPLAADARGIAQLTVDTLVRRSAEAVLASAFITDGVPADVVQSAVVQRALDRRFSVVEMPLGLSVPLVGLGASAATYYPPVGDLLRSDVVVPEHADVANAVGAVVGRIRIQHVATISSPQLGQFVVHAGGAPATVTDIEAARAWATDALSSSLAVAMTAAGAASFDVEWKWTQRTAEIAGTEMLIEASLTAVGTGRPTASG